MIAREMEAGRTEPGAGDLPRRARRRGGRVKYGPGRIVQHYDSVDPSEGLTAPYSFGGEEES